MDPLYGITTDIIVDPLGRRKKTLPITSDVVDKAFFGRVHAFKFSPRKGTEAAKYKETRRCPNS